MLSALCYRGRMRRQSASSFAIDRAKRRWKRFGGFGRQDCGGKEMEGIGWLGSRIATEKLATLWERAAPEGAETAAVQAYAEEEK